jgi:hypothetical protein
MVVNSKDATNTAEDDDDDLFGSDDEEEDAEAAKQREANLAAYKKKKEGKTKPAAKSIVTLDVKPWGKVTSTYSCMNTTDRTFRRRDRHEGARKEPARRRN